MKENKHVGLSVTDCMKKDLDKKVTWFDSVYYWVRHGVWNWLSDLQWRVPNYFERAWNGFGHADTWGFDNYLAKVIYSGLVHLKKHKHGSPIVIPQKAGEWTKKDYQVNDEAWDKIMDEMINAFRLAKEIGDGTREFYLPKMNKKFRKEQKCLTRDEDRAMKRGFKLFTQHFFNLWD